MFDHADSDNGTIPQKHDSCILATHATDIQGPPDALATYLQNRTEWLVVMKFPLSADDMLKPGCEIYRDGQPIERRTFGIRIRPFLLNYVIDLLLILYWSLCIIAKYKLTSITFFGCNNYVTLSGLALKGCRQVKTVVFYSIDYSQQRFSNRLLNCVYRYIDKIAATKSAFVWSNTNRTRAIRTRQGIREASNILVPNGVYSDLITPSDGNGRHDHGISIEYHGHLTESKGVQNVIDALDKLGNPNFSLDIIGSGPFEGRLRAVAARSKYKDKITFVGRRSYKETIAALSKYDLSVALISPKEDYIRYCDPVKIKEALASNVPVLVSNVPEIAQLIKQRKLGIVVENAENVEEIARRLGDLFANIGVLAEYRKNIAEIRKDFDWNNIYDKPMQLIKAT